MLGGRLDIREDEARRAGPAVVQALRAAREHAVAVIEPVRQGERPPASALSALNRIARACPPAPEAHWDGDRVVTTPVRGGGLAERLASAFASATIELAGAPEVRNVRRCEAPACVMLFLARNPRRRWCTPSICGNRVRVARYHLRHKDEPDELTASPGA